LPFGSSITSCGVKVPSAVLAQIVGRAQDLVTRSREEHHCDDPPAAGPELARVLRPGGRVYLDDVRSAPFQDLIAAVAGASLSAGPLPRQALIRVGVPLFPRVVRYILSDAVTPASL
jgi:ubiquinone/menaquinone biosynthesis C-methylase UbiE